MYNVADSSTYYYRAGANKNVMALTSGKDVVAQYEYSPFGTIITQTGDLAAVNPFRFSSEYHDDETGLIYYNYRYYNPTLGRWLSRDPIGEDGGENLYGFIDNDPINSFDELGCIMGAGEFFGSMLDFGRNFKESLYKLKLPFIDPYNVMTGQPKEPPYQRVPDYSKYKNCIEKCILKAWPLAAAGGGMTALGAESIPKGHGAGAFGGSRGTSIVSWSLSKVKWLNIKLPFRIPTITGRTGIKGATRRLPSILGRWSSIVGPVLIGYDLYKYNSCLNDCMEDPCQ